MTDGFSVRFTNDKDVPPADLVEERITHLQTANGAVDWTQVNCSKHSGELH